MAHAQMGPPLPEPPALVEMRKKFEAAAARETVGLNELFAPHLANLEMNAGASGDYALALSAKRRRENLVAASQRLKEVAAPAPGITLPLASARVSGGVTWNAGVLDNWAASTSGAEWTLTNIQPGRYVVRIVAAVAPPAVAVPMPLTATLPTTPPVAAVRFREVSNLTIAATNSATISVTSANGNGSSVPEQPTAPKPIVTVQRLPVTFRLELMNAGQIAFRLMQVVLEPVNEALLNLSGPPANAATESAAVSLALQKAEELHNERMKQAMTPVVQDYLELLAGLGEKGAGARVVQAETKRVTKFLESGTESFFQLAPSVSKSGLTTLTDVKYVADPGNTGDRFKVEHEGESFWVKLMWTVCPPMDARKGRTMDLIKSRFGIDELGAVAIGHAAREFTELYLTGKPLKLLARATPAPDGTLVALVYLETTGLFQHVLIDHGLALVDGPEDKGYTRKAALEAGLLADMLEHEGRARKAAEEGGGWYRGK
ncbi:MAG: hypothetical protein JNJ83_09885 [Verrucomicrobiaceae bacterium]|nr:hypothetical protein [Verrucomicrobiaceae bacterium]